MLSSKQTALVATILALVWAAVALGADFTQPARDVEFTKNSRRADKMLKATYGELVPADVDFCYQGRFLVTVHREGLDRHLSLIPACSLDYPDAETLRAAARKKPVLVGALDIPFYHESASIEPGTHMLLYDGLRLQMRDTHNHLVASVLADIGPAPEDAKVDPVIGTLDGTPTSIANVTPEGRLELFIQLSQSGKALTSEHSFVKLLVSAEVPGIVTDDSSPERQLAVPKEEDEEGNPVKKVPEK